MVCEQLVVLSPSLAPTLTVTQGQPVALLLDTHAPSNLASGTTVTQLLVYGTLTHAPTVEASSEWCDMKLCNCCRCGQHLQM